MKLFKNLIVLLLMVICAGCGIAAKVRARNDMENSKTAYKQCLQQHLNDLEQCEGLKRAYEADLKAYKATSNGVRPGHTTSLEINE